MREIGQLLCRQHQVLSLDNIQQCRTACIEPLTILGEARYILRADGQQLLLLIGQQNIALLKQLADGGGPHPTA